MTNIITVDCYREMCDSNYVRGEPLPKGDVIFVNPEDADEIFLQLSFFPNRKVILVSAHSDYGIHYQNESHPNKDIKKIIYQIDFQGLEQQQNYIPIQIVTWNQQRCNPQHRFSVKIDRFTICTFNKIPSNVVKWFCCNANVNEKQIEFLPFGVNNEGHGKDIVESYRKDWKDKQKQVYFNLQFNSTRRIQLHEYFNWRKQQENNAWLTYKEQPNCSIEQFYEDLSSHKFIMNCESNGLDGYRNWEALLVGSMPLVEENRWSKNAVDAGFNFIVVKDLTNIDEAKLTLLETFASKPSNPEMLQKQFWQEKITQARELLTNE